MALHSTRPDSVDDRRPRRSKLTGHERTRRNAGNRAFANRRIVAAQGYRLGGNSRHRTYRGTDEGGDRLPQDSRTIAFCDSLAQ
jgi:hypothetical protein